MYTVSTHLSLCSDHCGRAEASEAGCQMDIVLYTELMADDMVRTIIASG